MDKLLHLTICFGLISILMIVLVKKVYPYFHAPYYLTPATIALAILVFVVITYYKIID